MIFTKDQYNQADQYYEILKKKGARIEIINKNIRTYSQNRYLHLILSYFGMQTGYTLETVKQKIFKLLVNKDTFLVCENGTLGEMQTIRSTKGLSTKEMNKCIEKFHMWSLQEAEIELPTPDDKKWLSLIEAEAKNNNYL